MSKEDLKPSHGDEIIVTPKIQKELFVKYGDLDPEELAVLLGGNQSKSTVLELSRKALYNFVNKLMSLEIDLEDVDYVSAMLPERFAVSREDYAMFVILREASRPVDIHW